MFSKTQIIPRSMKSANGTGGALDISDSIVKRIGRGTSGGMLLVTAKIKSAAVGADFDLRIAREQIITKWLSAYGYHYLGEPGNVLASVAVLMEAMSNAEMFADADNLKAVGAGLTVDFDIVLPIITNDSRREDGLTGIFPAEYLVNFEFKCADICGGQDPDLSCVSWTAEIWNQECDNSLITKVGTPLFVRSLKITDTSQELPEKGRTTDLFFVTSAAGFAADSAAYYELTRNGVKLLEYTKGIDVARFSNSMHDAEYNFTGNQIVLMGQGFGYDLDDIPIVDNMTLEKRSGGSYHADTDLVIVGTLPITDEIMMHQTKIAGSQKVVLVKGRDGTINLPQNVKEPKRPWVPYLSKPMTPTLRTTLDTMIKSGGLLKNAVKLG